MLPSCSRLNPKGCCLLSGQVLGTEPSLALQLALQNCAVLTQPTMLLH